MATQTPQPSPGISCPMPHKPSPPPPPTVQSRPWGEANLELPTETQGGGARVLGVGNRLPGCCPTVPGIHSPKLNPAPPGLPPPPRAQDNVSPAPRYPLPTSQRSIHLIPSKGPISLRCFQLRGCLLSPRACVPQFLPAPLPASVTPIPICFPPHSHTHPLSWLFNLSASLSSPAVGGWCWGALAPQRHG